MGLYFPHQITLEVLPSGSGYLFDPTTGYVYNLNEVGVVVMSALLEKPILEFAAQRVFEAFEVPDSSSGHRDLVAFIQKLQDYGILEDRP